MTTSVIATTPNAMVEAQQKLLGWIDRKLEEIEGERNEAEALMVQLRIARTATTHADKILDACRRRERFYEKVKAALAAGFYIIPPMDCQVFAVRTDREIPPPELSGNRRTWNVPKGLRALPPGEGRYVAPIPVRELSHQNELVDKTDPTKKRFENIYSNEEWLDVEFPVRAMKPQLIEASAGAMQLKIFDALAIAPEYRDPDPIIVGQIKHWKHQRRPLNFFVAWWLDYEDL